MLGAAALAVAVLALVLALGARRRSRGATARSTPAASGPQDLAALQRRVEDAERALAAVRSDLAQGLRHVAVVRYDAFGDMGGRMSFSAALVDDHGDGMVISAIHARGESRTYAKGVTAGDSSITLTPEERQALAAAREGGRAGAGA